MLSSTVSAAQTITAAATNLFRKDTLVNGGDYGTSGGAANVQTLSIDAQYVAYTAGDKIKFKAGFTNTSSMTINVNSIGAKAVNISTTNGLIALSGGEIQGSEIVEMVYDGTVFQLLTAPLSPYQTVSGLTTGEAINGTATVPLCVCVKASDGLIYKAKGNDTTLLNAFGFINTNASITTTPSVIYSGIVSGFSGLTKGATYYATDTAGTISTIPSTTTQIPVGRALSATQLEIAIGKKRAFGTSSSGSVNASTNTAVVCGFAPATIEIEFVVNSPSDIHSVSGTGHGVFANGSLNFQSGINITYNYDNSSPPATFVLFSTLGGSATASSGGSFTNAYSTTIALTSNDTTGFTWNTTPSHSGGSATINYIVSE